MIEITVFYSINTKIAAPLNHLLFMDDLKIYAETDQKLNQLIEAVREFSSDIKMEFGLDKCSKCTIKKGKKNSSRKHTDRGWKQY